MMNIVWLLLAFMAHAAAAPQQPAAPAATPPVSAQPAAPGPSAQAAPLKLLSGSELPRFDDSLTTKKARANLVKAAQKAALYLSKSQPKLFRIADRDYGPAILEATAREFIALWQQDLPPEEFNAKVAEDFDVFMSVGSDGQGKVVFSSYYQPELPASMAKSPKYPYPIYKKPPDILEVGLADFDKKYPADTLIGRVDKDKKVVPYFNRDQIDSHKALAGKGLELAWLPTKFDILDLHIQGSGILMFPSGRKLLAQFAATNAWTYNSVGLSLVKAGVFTREEITHEKLRRYFRDHPEAQEWAMAQNPRYTFFKLMPLPADGEPMGTAEQSLNPGRAIAIDPSIIPLGALAYFSTLSPQADSEGKLVGKFPTNRFAFCLDTGGAIKGPGRVDIYAGHGKMAAEMAKNQWADGQLYILVKKVPARER
ncbi:MAG: MltA domain-containing protein [Elusimicrobia bacterium]|nr:MltA domain-containing protein [Elusimicrobiota bacterium]